MKIFGLGYSGLGISENLGFGLDSLDLSKKATSKKIQVQSNPIQSNPRPLTAAGRRLAVAGRRPSLMFVSVPVPVPCATLARTRLAPNCFMRMRVILNTYTCGQRNWKERLDGIGIVNKLIGTVNKFLRNR